MGFIIFIGLILACAGWFVYIRTPSWLLLGAPSFMTPIIKLIQVPNDFFGIETFNRLRDYSLICCYHWNYVSCFSSFTP